MYQSLISALHESLQCLKNFYIKYKSLPIRDSENSIFIVSNDPEEIIGELLKNVKALSKTICQIWISFNNILVLHRGKITKDLIIDYENLVEENYRVLMHNNLSEDKMAVAKSRHSRYLRRLRKQNKPVFNFQKIKSLDVLDALIPPLIFEEVRILSSSVGNHSRQLSKNLGIHLFVLVHGLQGNSMNM